MDSEPAQLPPRHFAHQLEPLTARGADTTPTPPALTLITMTYKEWMTTTANRFGIGAADVELILCNQAGLIPDPVEQVNPAVAKRALVAEFAAMIPLANVSEGGYSVSWNWEAIKFWYNQTCSELGITPQGKPKVRNRSNRW